MKLRSYFLGPSFSIFLLIVLVTLSLVSAHQPRLVSESSSLENSVVVNNPEISQAFYGELKGSPAYYKISSNKEFRLYVNLLVPDTPGSGEKLISAEILDENLNVLALLDGKKFDWKPFFEPFGGDNYLKGPEYNETVAAGTYYIRVFNTENKGFYSLAVGGIETFPPDEAFNALVLLPLLKAGFFQVPVAEVFPQLVGIILALGVYIVLYLMLIKARKSEENLELALKVFDIFNPILWLGIIITTFFWLFNYLKNPLNILGGIETLLLILIIILHWNLNSNLKSGFKKSLPLKRSTLLMLFWWLFVFLRVVLI